MLALWRVGRQSSRASVRCKTSAGNQIGPAQKRYTAAAQPTLQLLTCGGTSPGAAGAGILRVKYRSLARSSIDILGKRKHRCCRPRSSAARGSAGVEKPPMSTTNAISKRAGLSTKKAMTAASPPLNQNPSTRKTWLRLANWRASRASGKAKNASGGGDVAAGGSKQRFWLPPRQGDSGGKALVHGLVALNVAGTLVWFVGVGDNWAEFAFNLATVSTDNTLGQSQLHTLFTSNFSHSDVLDGVMCSYIVYRAGLSTIGILGKGQFLALYVFGGAFSQLCQVAGPIVATKLGLPTILQVDPSFSSSGGWGPAIALLTWYGRRMPLSRIMILGVPFEVDIAGQIFKWCIGFTLVQVARNQQVSYVVWTGSSQEIWRRLSAVAVGFLVAFATRGRGRHGNTRKP